MTKEDLLIERDYIASFTEGTGNPSDKIRVVGRGLTFMSEKPMHEPDIIKKIFDNVCIPKMRVRDCSGDIIPAFADKFDMRTLEVDIETVAYYLINNWKYNYADKKTYIILRGVLYQSSPGKKLTYKRTAKIIDEIIKKSK